MLLKILREDGIDPAGVPLLFLISCTNMSADSCWTHGQVVRVSDPSPTGIGINSHHSKSILFPVVRRVISCCCWCCQGYGYPGYSRLLYLLWTHEGFDELQWKLPFSVVETGHISVSCQRWAFLFFHHLWIRVTDQCRTAFFCYCCMIVKMFMKYSLGRVVHVHIQVMGINAQICSCL